MVRSASGSGSILSLIFFCRSRTHTTPTRRKRGGNCRLSSQTESPLQNAYAEWLATLAPWGLYLTLTYDRKRWYSEDVPPSHWSAARHVRSYHHEATELLRRPVYLAATHERTRAGWPHWHGLLAAGEVSRVEFAALSQAWFSAHGFAHFARIQTGTQGVVSQYVSKYMVKEDCAAELLGPWQNGGAPLQRSLGFVRGPSGLGRG